MLLYFTLACAPVDAPVCAEFPPSAVANPGSLHNEDNCGYWSVLIGEYLVVSVEMTEPDQDCSMALGDGLGLEYDPTYSNLEDNENFEGGPKWTWQVFGETVATASPVDVVCTEGTEWSALVDVVE